MSRIVGLIRRTFGIVREHVGSDHLGNHYYVVPQQKTWTGADERLKCFRMKRFMVMRLRRSRSSEDFCGATSEGAAVALWRFGAPAASKQGNPIPPFSSDAGALASAAH
ncbi:unnamed protein product [Merluccius merluccius]